MPTKPKALGAEIVGEPLEPLRAAGEVALPEVGRATDRPVGGVRDPDPVPEHLELLGWIHEPRGEARGVEQAQKSLRGLAKCAAFASEWKPGLMPQKTTARSGASTSGTALFETAATVAHPSALQITAAPVRSQNARRAGLPAPPLVLRCVF